MIRSNISQDQATEANLHNFCFEVGTEFERLSQELASIFVPYLEKKEVLELGCGDGAAVRAFLELGVSVTGVDINPEKLARIPVSERVRIVRSDMLDYLKILSDGSVPNIFSSHALEHLADPSLVINEIARVLAPGGYCFLVVPSQDVIHSVHFTVFEYPSELVPPCYSVNIVMIQTTGGDLPEYRVITQKR